MVQPDLEFKRKILGLGARDLTSCYQCGTCSVVCPISAADNPFPRKEMIWTQWGLKDRALGNSSIWLCHQCATCTAYCPRDAKPANVMAALRDYSITHYAAPRFMGRAFSGPKSLPFLFAIPTMVFLAVLAWVGNLNSLPTGEIVFAKFMPHLYIEAIFILAMGFSTAAALLGGVRYWRAMGAQSGGPHDGYGPGKNLFPTLLDIFRHQKFRACEEDPVGNRKTYKGHLHKTHLAAFYGFLGLVITTTSVAIGIYIFSYYPPLPVLHPVKILGNVSGIALIIALVVFTYRRIRDKEKAGKSTYSDWLFLDILLLTVLTGFLSQISRLADVATLAYPVYFVHLVFVFFLLVYIPYSKFAHLVYRSTAMLSAASSGKSFFS